MEQIELIEAESRKIFDYKSLTIDYSKKRATDLTENSEVKLPLPSDPSTESALHVLKNKIMRVFRDYKSNNCNSEGAQKCNLTPIEQKGYLSLKKRIKEGEILTLKTDKSGKMTIISMEEYLKLGLERTKS